MSQRNSLHVYLGTQLVDAMRTVFDLNPFPDKSPESKTWLSEDTGPITSINQLLSKAAYFELTPPQAEAVVAEVKHAVKNWKAVAAGPDVGMQAAEMKAFEAAFEGAFV